MQIFVTFAETSNIRRDFFQSWIHWWDNDVYSQVAVDDLHTTSYWEQVTPEKWMTELHGAISAFGGSDQKGKTLKGLQWLTLLHVAAYEGYDQELEMLLTLKRYRRCINDSENLTNERNTALHLACRESNIRAMAVLLNQKTIRPEMKNGEGLTPYETIQRELGPIQKDLETVQRKLRYIQLELASMEYSQEKLKNFPVNIHKREVYEIFRSKKEEMRCFGSKKAILELKLSRKFLAQRLLLDHPEVTRDVVEQSKREVDRLYTDRQVYVDAANAILVGAALIASVTFAGWLQPPLGYTQYYQTSFPNPAPPSSPESFAAVEQHNSVRIFWVFNSLSFYSAVATVVTGAGAVLPSKRVTGIGSMLQSKLVTRSRAVLPSKRVTPSGAVLPSELESMKKEVNLVRKWLNATSALLSISIFCVLGAFTAAGSASLPSIGKYQMDMIWTAAIGLCLCVVILSAFCYRLYLATGLPKDYQAFMFLFLMFVSVTLLVETRPLMQRISNG